MINKIFLFTLIVIIIKPSYSQSNIENVVTISSKHQSPMRINTSYKLLKHELGGNIKLSGQFAEDNHKAIIQVEPIYIKYFSLFYMGPLVGLAISKEEMDNILGIKIHDNHMYFGALFGSLLRNSKNILIPFIQTGLGGLWLNSSKGNVGIIIPTNIGIKIRIGQSGLINYGLCHNFKRINGANINLFDFYAGVSIGM